MSNISTAWARAAVGVALATAVGCNTTTTAHKPHQFEPAPPPEVGARDLEPVRPRSTTAILRAAEASFREANAAQEKGDVEAALRHYKDMLALLTEADLDPVIFYNLRREFARILDSTSQQVYLFERGKPRDWSGLDLADTAVAGDLPIPFPLPERVLREIEEIQEVYPKGYQAGLNRSFRYAPRIRRELAEAGLPQDLAWLAMVESQFKPQANSPAGARGMWQFMRQTGQRYGLRVNDYVDERYNWEKATRAAILYLRDLYEQFGEWPLAVSAYNMGEHGMERTVASAGGEKDLWRILETPVADRHMQLETRKFYPKLSATILVASSPTRYGFTIAPEPPDTSVRVPVKGSYSLTALDRACGLPRGTLATLNRDLIRGVTPPSGEHMVAVPVEVNAKFVAALKKVSPEHSRSLAATVDDGSPYYVVRRGDTPGTIAARFKVSYKELMRINNIRSARHLQVGKRIRIPGRGSVQSGASAPASQTYSASASAERKKYRVRRGDTLIHIAKRHGVGVSDLKAWNRLDKSTIRVNQLLYVSPAVSSSAPPTGASRRVHVVQPGECPGTIAEAYGVGLSELLQWNNLSRKSVIRANDKLVVYVAGDGASAEAGAAVLETSGSQSTDEPPAQSPPAAPGAGMKQARVHRVVAGDTAGAIAQRYGIKLSDFLSWNGLTKKSVLRVGEEHVVSRAGEAADAAPVEVARADAEPAPRESSEKPTPQPGQGDKKTYRVEAGQNPWTIAKKRGVKHSDLLQWNGWDKGTTLHVGQEYVVYSSAAEGGQAPAAPAETGKEITHRVSSGQNPTTIARRYGVRVSDLFEWNGWRKGHVLHVGDRVVVRQ